jgi:ABC-type cobalamin/Fe3+-siderophores transport system ATPase subunit
MNISIENLSLEIGDKKILTNINFDFKSYEI